MFAPSCCAGVVARACVQGKRAQHGKPHLVTRDRQPVTREGWTGRYGVAERFVVPMKPGNADGGKGPQFETDARRSEEPAAKNSAFSPPVASQNGVQFLRRQSYQTFCGALSQHREKSASFDTASADSRSHEEPKANVG